MTDEEAVAKVIFTHWQFQRSCPGGQFLWVDGGNSHKQDEARDFARAAIAALTAQGWRKVEPGEVVVPVEPTPEMIGAGWKTIRREQPMGKAFGSPGPALAEAYRAMIDAATKKPAPQGKGAGRAEE